MRSARRHGTRNHARSRVADMAERQVRRHVLIVEDEPALRNHYERFFSSRYELTFAASGAEAMERLAEATPDVAVLDMRLPDTDGVALLREIHVAQPELPVIIATAFLSIEPQLQLLDVPYTDYIVKPFRLDELGARIDAAL
jgi:DNA-binding response OmpR family regulator